MFYENQNINRTALLYYTYATARPVSETINQLYLYIIICHRWGRITELKSFAVWARIESVPFAIAWHIQENIQAHI